MRAPEDRRNLAILFVSGLGLMLLDYVLVRQLAASFADLESSAILMTLGYFAGVSIGYFRPESVSPARIRMARGPSCSPSSSSSSSPGLSSRARSRSGPARGGVRWSPSS